MVLANACYMFPWCCLLVDTIFGWLCFYPPYHVWKFHRFLFEGTYDDGFNRHSPYLAWLFPCPFFFLYLPFFCSPIPHASSEGTSSKGCFILPREGPQGKQPHAPSVGGLCIKLPWTHSKSYPRSTHMC